MVSDHKTLLWIINIKEPGSRLLRWRIKLEEYDYDIVYKKGALSTNADALSGISELELEEKADRKMILVRKRKGKYFTNITMHRWAVIAESTERTRQ
jgi:hypothetical protein